MASRKTDVVGIIGLGIMGGSFAQNLVAAGWRVIGYDVDPSRCRALARLGVEIAADAGDVARKTKTIITSLPSPKVLAATVAAIVKAKVPRRVIVRSRSNTVTPSRSASTSRSCQVRIGRWSVAMSFTSCPIDLWTSPAPASRTGKDVRHEITAMSFDIAEHV